MKKSEQVKKRRKKAKIASTSKAVKNSKASARHKSDKLSPKDDCRSNKGTNPATKKPATRKRRTRCKNCNSLHNGPCEEPSYVNASTGTKQNKKAKIGKYTRERLSEMLANS